MTHKEIAERLRDLIDGTSNGIVLSESIQCIADDLDPPLPEPGTVVWWRDAEGLGEWSLGQINNNRKVEFFGACKELDLEAIQIKPARIAGPMQEIINIPPVSEWPGNAGQILAMYCTVTSARVAPLIQVITRDEAARREAEG